MSQLAYNISDTEHPKTIPVPRFETSPLRTLFAIKNATNHLDIQKSANNVSTFTVNGKLIFKMKETFIEPRTWVTFDNTGNLVLAVCRYPILEWFPQIPWSSVKCIKMKNNKHVIVFESKETILPPETVGDFQHNGCTIPSLGIAIPISSKLYRLISREQNLGLSTFLYTAEGMIDLDDEVQQYAPVQQ